MAKKKGPGRPSIPPNERKKGISLKLSPILLARVESKAKRTGHKLTYIIEHTLENYLDLAIGGA